MSEPAQLKIQRQLLAGVSVSKRLSMARRGAMPARVRGQGGCERLQVIPEAVAQSVKTTGDG